jgi:hypothetical protein
MHGCGQALKTLALFYQTAHCVCNRRIAAAARQLANCGEEAIEAAQVSVARAAASPGASSRTPEKGGKIDAFRPETSMP